MRFRRLLVLFLRGEDRCGQHRVGLNAQTLRVVLAVHREHHAVHARCHEAAAAGPLPTTAGAAGATARAAAARQVPRDAVQARLVLWPQCRHRLAGVVQHLQRHALLGFLTEGVVDLRPTRRVVADPVAAAGAVDRAALRLRPPARRRHRLEQFDVLLRRCRLQLPQGRNVEHPQAAAVRRRHHLAGRRVLGEIVDRHGRQVVVDLRPRLAAVERHERRELGTEVQHVLVLDVLAQAAG